MEELYEYSWEWGSNCQVFGLTPETLDSWRLGKTQLRCPVNVEMVDVPINHVLGAEVLIGRGRSGKSLKGELTEVSESGPFCLECGEWFVSCKNTHLESENPAFES